MRVSLIVLGVVVVLVAILFIVIPIIWVAPSYLGTPNKIDQEFFARIDDDELEDALVKFVMNRKVSSNHDQEQEIVNSLPVGLKYLYVTWLFEMEVYNGGIPQFFYNSSGVFARLARDGYHYFGADDMAEVIEEAISTYESEKHLYLRARETGDHKDFVALYENPVYEKLEERFLVLIEALGVQRVQFIRENEDIFFCD